MKIFLSTILTSCLLFAGTAMAQTEEQQKASLNAAPTPALQEQAAAQAEKKPSMLSMPANRVSYGLSMGASFGNGFAATYLEPSVRYQVSPRLRAFGSFTYVTGMPQLYTDHTPEGGTIIRRSSPGNQYIVNAGAEYLVNERLILSGSVWKDFSNVPAVNPAYNNYMTPGRQGMDFRAIYKITDNFTVTGAMRYSNGPSPYYNPFLNTGFGGSGGSFW